MGDIFLANGKAMTDYYYSDDAGNNAFLVMNRVGSRIQCYQGGGYTNYPYTSDTSGNMTSALALYWTDENPNGNYYDMTEDAFEATKIYIGGNSSFTVTQTFLLNPVKVALPIDRYTIVGAGTKTWSATQFRDFLNNDNSWWSPDDRNFFICTLQGAGGGGGGGATWNNAFWNGEDTGGQGGASGCTVVAKIDASGMSSSSVITLRSGGGGAGGAAYKSGSDGGTSYLEESNANGRVLSAPGGTGGGGGKDNTADATDNYYSKSPLYNQGYGGLYAKVTDSYSTNKGGMNWEKGADSSFNSYKYGASSYYFMYSKTNNNIITAITLYRK